MLVSCFDVECELFPSLQELWAFILRLNAAVQDKKVSNVEVKEVPPIISALVEMLKELETWVDVIPPTEQASRFGNVAFRTWHQKLSVEASCLVAAVLAAADDVEDSDGSMAEELAAYLETSFGNETRIDYGTGHEAHFCLLLFLLERAGVYGENEYATVVLVVFRAYLRVTRKLQTVYMLEPAGSHGVWGLDDYSFLPFLWGSSQLLSSTRIKPTVVDDDQELLELRDEYLYLDAIAFVKEMKKGPFFEHSPMLYDISRVRAGWPKINQGMLKMYKGEVWHKLPVIQAFLFGNMFRFDKAESDIGRPDP